MVFLVSIQIGCYWQNNINVLHTLAEKQILLWNYCPIHLQWTKDDASQNLSPRFISNYYPNVLAQFQGRGGVSWPHTGYWCDVIHVAAYLICYYDTSSTKSV